MELRSLSDEARLRVLALRQSYETLVSAILSEGMAAGIFAVRDAKVSSFAIIGMLTSVCQWYRPGGRLGPDAIIAIHRDLVLQAVRKLD